MEEADTYKSRRDAKKRGQYGTDWYKYPNGVPPEDDNGLVLIGLKFGRNDE